MASTLRPVDAFIWAKKMIKGMPLDRISARILDDANKYLWMASPWRWTITSTSELTMVANQIDYTLAAPADFLHGIYAIWFDGTTTPEYMKFEPYLHNSLTMKGNPSRIAYTGSNNFRIYPCPSTFSGTRKIVIWYKKTAPVITNQTMFTAGVQVFDDEWFWVYEQIVLWQAYLYADDERAGGAQQTASGQWTFNGQRAQAEAAIQLMREREPLPILDYKTAPDPIVVAR